MHLCPTHKLSAKHVRQIRKLNADKGARAALEYANELLDGHGVEYIAHRDDTFTRSYGLQYVNMGDTYISTLIYDWLTGRFLWGADWGSIVESREGQYE